MRTCHSWEWSSGLSWYCDQFVVTIQSYSAIKTSLMNIYTNSSFSRAPNVHFKLPQVEIFFSNFPNIFFSRRRCGEGQNHSGELNYCTHYVHCNFQTFFKRGFMTANRETWQELHHMLHPALDITRYQITRWDPAPCLPSHLGKLLKNVFKLLIKLKVLK